MLYWDMKLSLALFTLLFATFASAQTAIVSENEFVDKTFYPAVVLLYSQEFDGSMHMKCTATAIEHTGDAYVMVSAAHCASADNEEKKLAEPEKDARFFVTFDESGDKTFIPAKILFCGYQHEGDDFCAFSVVSTRTIPTVALGKDPSKHVGEPVINVASPLGLGKQVFRGYISSPKLDRDVRENSINWSNAILMQLPGTNGGSSGSAIVCVEQRAICAFLVGSIEDTEIIALPVSRLLTLRTKIEAGTYEYWKKPKEDMGK